MAVRQRLRATFEARYSTERLCWRCSLRCYRTTADFGQLQLPANIEGDSEETSQNHGATQESVAPSLDREEEARQASLVFGKVDPLEQGSAIESSEASELSQMHGQNVLKHSEPINIRKHLSGNPRYPSPVKKVQEVYHKVDRSKQARATETSETPEPSLIHKRGKLQYEGPLRFRYHSYYRTASVKKKQELATWQAEYPVDREIGFGFGNVGIREIGRECSSEGGKDNRVAFPGGANRTISWGIGQRRALSCKHTPGNTNSHVEHDTKDSDTCMSAHSTFRSPIRNTTECSRLLKPPSELQGSCRQWKTGSPIVRSRFIMNRPYATTTDTHAASPHELPVMEMSAKLKSALKTGNIRGHLKLWQEQQGRDADAAPIVDTPHVSIINGSKNQVNQSREEVSDIVINPETDFDEVEDDDHIIFESDAPELDVLKNQEFLRKGDLVEFKTATRPVLAIFVRHIATQSQFYAMDSRFLHKQSTQALFCVPNFVQPDEVESILPYLPEEEAPGSLIDHFQLLDRSAPRGAGATLLEKMALFHQAANDVFREHADRLNRVYDLISRTQPDRGRINMDLRQIALIVLQKKTAAELTSAMMWAVHRALMQSQNITRTYHNPRQNVRYVIHPRHRLADIVQVQQWMRDYQESVTEAKTEGINSSSAEPDVVRSMSPIPAFLKKSRAAIVESRRTRPLSSNGSLGPSSVKVEPVEPDLATFRSIALEKFTANERIIIHYIESWVITNSLNDATAFPALGPMILRAVGLYEDFELGRPLGFTFLQELGIVAPWKNSILNRIVMQLPDYERDSVTTRLHDAANRDFHKLKETRGLKDSMGSLRKDWGDLPVFCIDSADTLERDDGVSIESVDGTDTEYWVHVHVANPSAFIAPTSAIANYAADLHESIYLTERKHPMLHPSLTADYLSLDNDRPCLTFSARVSTGGEVLENKITPGIIHNVHYLTPQRVSHELGIDPGEAYETVPLLTVGGEMPTQAKQQVLDTEMPLSRSDVSMLHSLLKIGEAARLRRARNGLPNFLSVRKPQAYPKVFLGAHIAPSQVNDEAITRYDGDPIISILRTTGGDVLVNRMVTDLMILAGETAASWCSSRNIPIVYRGMLRNPEPSTSPELFRSQVIDTQIEQCGQADRESLTFYIKLLGRPATSASPIEHLALGLPAYCRTTSPLRRYVDMVIHWQIEAGLRHEAITGTSLVHNAMDNNDAYLPFSRADVEVLASSSVQREKRITKATLEEQRHWVVQALCRAFYFEGAPMPETFEVRVVHGLHHGFQGSAWLVGWGLLVGIKANEVSRAVGVMEHDVWEAKVVSVYPYYRDLEVGLIRLITRGQ